MGNENELAGVQGSCLCGSVRFELLGKINGFISATACAVGVPPGLPRFQFFTDPENIRWLSGQELIKRYELPEAERFAKQFCSECGSLVPLVNRDGTKLIIPAGTLEQSFEAHPQKNIFWDSKANGMSMGWKLQGLRSIKGY